MPRTANPTAGPGPTPALTVGANEQMKAAMAATLRFVSFRLRTPSNKAMQSTPHLLQTPRSDRNSWPRKHGHATERFSNDPTAPKPAPVPSRLLLSLLGTMRPRTYASLPGMFPLTRPSCKHTEQSRPVNRLPSFSARKLQFRLPTAGATESEP